MLLYSASLLLVVFFTVLYSFIDRLLSEKVYCFYHLFNFSLNRKLLINIFFLLLPELRLIVIVRDHICVFEKKEIKWDDRRDYFITVYFFFLCSCALYSDHFIILFHLKKALLEIENFINAFLGFDCLSNSFYLSLFIARIDLSLSSFLFFSRRR